MSRSVTVGDGMTKAALSVAMGSDFVRPVPGGEAAAKVTANVDIPVLLAGRIISGEAAEATLAAGKADLVAMTRAVIADPDLPTKLRTGRRVRPCIGINQGCIGRLYSGLPVVCSVNPAIRDPQLDKLRAADRPRRVVVVGGGVAGLEAARHAALRGHLVVLLERVITGTEATSAAVLSHSPDTVVIATGSELRARLGHPDGPVLVDADVVIARTPAPADNPAAVIIDDDCGMVAPTAAAALAAKGWQVTIATPLPMLAGEADAPRNFDAATAEGALVGAGIV